MQKKICIVTGSRAEYGLLKPLIEELKKNDKFQIQLLVTGMHLSPEFGLTYKEIEQDGNKISEKVEMLLSSDTPTGIAKSMGLALISLSEAYSRLNPDLVILLGDRFEIFAAATAANITHIPIAHLNGGELTFGVIDDNFRHAITKMSNLHFASTEENRKRVIQLGEEPERVFNVGAIGLDSIKILKLLSREELEQQLNFKFNKRNLLVTFHPVTLEAMTVEDQFNNLLAALKELTHTNIILTKANADTDGRIINRMIDEFAAENQENCRAYASLGQLRYLSALQFVDAVVGNSSSGIVEAPSFKIATINIGDRQKGREQAGNAINCGTEKDEICKALKEIYSPEFRKKIENAVNPYGMGNTSVKIAALLNEILDNQIDLKKKFFDIEWSNYVS